MSIVWFPRGIDTKFEGSVVPPATQPYNNPIDAFVTSALRMGVAPFEPFFDSVFALGDAGTQARKMERSRELHLASFTRLSRKRNCGEKNAE